eukprot:3263291-Lingulodinium_polyedra.AAC.1
MILTSDAQDQGVPARCVLFVNWTDPSARRGRVVKVDNHNRFIYNIPAFVKVVQFVDCYIIDPAIDAVVSKAKSTLRTDVPRASLSLKAMWEALVESQSSLANATFDRCEGCTSYDTTLQCALCLLSWRPQCCKRVLTEA